MQKLCGITIVLIDIQTKKKHCSRSNFGGKKVRNYLMKIFFKYFTNCFFVFENQFYVDAIKFYLFFQLIKLFLKNTRKKIICAYYCKSPIYVIKKFFNEFIDIFKFLTGTIM